MCEPVITTYTGIQVMGLPRFYTNMFSLVVVVCMGENLPTAHQ